MTQTNKHDFLPIYPQVFFIILAQKLYFSQMRKIIIKKEGKKRNNVVLSKWT